MNLIFMIMFKIYIYIYNHLVIGATAGAWATYIQIEIRPTTRRTTTLSLSLVDLRPCIKQSTWYTPSSSPIAHGPLPVRGQI